MVSRTFIVLILLCLIGCSDKDDKNKNGINTYVIVYDFESNSYRLEKRIIPSLKKPTDLSTYVAKFYYKKPHKNHHKYEDPVKLNLARGSSNLYIPEDIQTLNVVSAYYQYDRLYNHHKKLGLLSYADWPKQVNIEATKSRFKDNASHNPIDNYTNYYPFNKDRLPPHLNPGIIAHEEVHNVFFKQVYEMGGDESTYNCLHALVDFTKNFKCQNDYQAASIKPAVVAHNYTVYRAFEEGLADFSGYLFSGNPDFFFASRGNYMLTRLYNRQVKNYLVMGRLPSQDELEKVVNDRVGITRKNQNRLNNTSSVSSFPKDKLDILMQQVSNTDLLGVSYTLAGEISSAMNMLAEHVVVPNSHKHLDQHEYLFVYLVSRLKKLRSSYNVTVQASKNESLGSEGYSTPNIEAQRVEYGSFFRIRVGFAHLFNLLIGSDLLNPSMCFELRKMFVVSEVHRECL